MMLRNIQIALASTEPFSGFIPECDIFSSSCLILETRRLTAVMSGRFGTKFATIPEALCFEIAETFGNGCRSVFNKVRPIVTPENLQGRSPRVMEGLLIVNTLDKRSCSALPMPFSELCIPLEHGVSGEAAKAAENMLNDRFYDVIGQVPMTKHDHPLEIVAISKRPRNDLSAERYAGIIAESQPCGTVKSREIRRLSPISRKSSKPSP